MVYLLQKPSKMLPLEEIVLEVFATPTVMLVYQERISSLTALFGGDRVRCEDIKIRMPSLKQIGILGTLCVPFLSFRTSQST